jgi:hypothetical protein
VTTVCHWTIVVCYYGGCVPLAVIVYHWTIVVCYYGGCVPLAVIVYHWTIVVCYYGGCVPLAVIVYHWTIVVYYYCVHWTIVVCYSGCVPLAGDCVSLDNSCVLLWLGSSRVLLDGIVVACVLLADCHGDYQITWEQLCAT